MPKPFVNGRVLAAYRTMTAQSIKAAFLSGIAITLAACSYDDTIYECPLKVEDMQGFVAELAKPHEIFAMDPETCKSPSGDRSPISFCAKGSGSSLTVYGANPKAANNGRLYTLVFVNLTWTDATDSMKDQVKNHLASMFQNFGAKHLANHVRSLDLKISQSRPETMKRITQCTMASGPRSIAMGLPVEVVNAENK